MAEHTATAFVRLLRHAGLQVPVEATVRFTRALAEVGFDRPDGVYWAGRATLVHRAQDIEVYNRAFVAFFGTGPAGPAGARPAARQPELLLDAGPDAQPAAGPSDEHPQRPPDEVRTVRWSAAELLRHKDLAECTPAELDQAHRLVADLRTHADLRRSRRFQPHHGRGRTDLRRSVHRALRTDGEVLRVATRRPGHRPRRLVLVIDVSGSMEPYARALLRFAHASVAARRYGQVEVFALGTRLTRVTRELNSHDPDRALRAATAAVPDWAGGTRLGDGLARFNNRWGVRGLARGSTVVILSDGWDRGDPDELATEMARLRRVAHRLVWVNPLKASPGYAPLAQGMAAALPHVDQFVEGHSVDSLERLARLVTEGDSPGAARPARSHGHRVRASRAEEG